MRFPIATPLRRPEPMSTGLPFIVAFFLMTGLAAAPRFALAQAVGPTGTMGAAKTASTAIRPASTPSAPRAAKSLTSPLWSELTPPQQRALAPLAGAWPTISEAQKRKWLVISQSYVRLPAAGQEKLHGRMSEWVMLSPQERTQARLNFAETQQLSPDDKKAKWEAYLALPPEAKRKLAAGAASAAKPPATAAAVKPVPSQKMATLPRTGDAKPPRIAAAPNQVDHNTLLPQQVPPVAPVRTN